MNKEDYLAYRSRMDEYKLKISILKSEYFRLTAQMDLIDRDRKILLENALALFDQRSLLSEKISDSEADMLIKLGL